MPSGPTDGPYTGNELYTGNDQLVGVCGEEIVVQYPKQQMSRAATLLHAAWLVTLAEVEDGEFDRILLAVHNT